MKNVPLVAEQPPTSRARGSGTGPRSPSGSAAKPQSWPSVGSDASATSAGRSAADGWSGPASISRTRRPAALRRAASTQPADPAPTTMRSKAHRQPLLTTHSSPGAFPVSWPSPQVAHGAVPGSRCRCGRRPPASRRPALRRGPCWGRPLLRSGRRAPCGAPLGDDESVPASARGRARATARVAGRRRTTRGVEEGRVGLGPCGRRRHASTISGGVSGVKNHSRTSAGELINGCSHHDDLGDGQQTGRIRCIRHHLL